jgi:hypothetical protein
MNGIFAKGGADQSRQTISISELLPQADPRYKCWGIGQEPLATVREDSTTPVNSGHGAFKAI